MWYDTNFRLSMYLVRSAAEQFQVMFGAKILTQQKM